MPQTDQQKALETIRKLIKDIDIAMLTTISEDGLISRPMQTQEVEFDGDLWFLSKKDTDKYEELLHNPQVNVAYVGKSYVSMRGEAEVLDNRDQINDKIKELWSPMYEKILETTPDDPNLILIKVNVEAAEYWESGNLFKMSTFLFKRMLGQNTEGSELNQTVQLT